MAVYVWALISIVTAIIGYRASQQLQKPAPVANAKVIIVGASSGIGRSLALGYARRGADLILCARREDKLAEVASECRLLSSRHAKLVIGDVTTTKTQREIERAVVERFRGRLDYLVLNAGAISVLPVEELWDSGSTDRDAVGTRADEALRKIIEINAFAPINIAGRLMPMLIASKARVVVVSSMAGLIAAPTRSLYSASKHAVTGFFNAFRMEVERHGVSVTLVFPGTVDTELRKSAVDAGGRAEVAGSTKGKLSAQVCAEQIIEAGALRRKTLITPFKYWISTVLYAFAPDLVERLAKDKYGYA
ncbi:NAD(P)-binding protein [Linderina pennispora]|uniref:NAD(P)-binding protein n=1 Tax=Linderina pennispora TaxID=61395 RepID=A0A1Y1WFV0_9FUNG|nr:NAD(P)-binding protein [Linderina pennispora]ORX72367.1 NAD(P)-binding protein [Linderina pennispora]